jgi:hypothetical protein
MPLGWPSVLGAEAAASRREVRPHRPVSSAALPLPGSAQRVPRYAAQQNYLYKIILCTIFLISRGKTVRPYTDQGFDTLGTIA